jgi:hypothetical protein
MQKHARSTDFAAISILLITVLLSAALMVGCSGAGGGGQTGPALSDSEAQAVTGTVAAGVQAAISNAMASAFSSVKGIGERTSYPISASGPGYTVSGTESEDASGASFSLTITFSGYTYSGITFNSGSASYHVTVTLGSGGTESWNGTYTGSFNLTYGGGKYDYGWNLTMASSNGASFTYSGSFTINGKSYSWTGVT